MNSKKITIVYGLPDTNSGGSALGISLVNNLKRHFPKYHINYMSSHSRQDLIAKAYPYITSKHPDITILPYPMRARGDNYDTPNLYARKLKNILWAVRTFLSVFIILIPFLSRNKTLDEIKKSTFVICRGTHIFYDHKGLIFENIISKYWLCFPLLMAWRYRRPYVIYGQSFGPLHYIITRLLIRFVFNRAAWVLPREELSMKYLKNVLHINPDRIRIVPDSVFSLDPPQDEEVKAFCNNHRLPYKRYAVLVVRELIDKSNRIDKNFYVFRQVCQHIMSRHFVDNCVIVTQCNHIKEYKGFESDSKVSRNLFTYLRKKQNGTIILIDKSMSPDELLCLYGGARYVITVRFHTAILSLVAGTPTIPISYWGFKTKGIMQMLNMSTNVFDINDLDSSSIISALEHIEQHYDDETAKIKHKMMNLRNKAKDSLLTIKTGSLSL